jgi:hypothetical protein
MSDHEPPANAAEPDIPDIIESSGPQNGGHQPVERLWDDDGFRARTLEVAQLRGLSQRDVIIGAGTSTKYFEPSAGRNTNIVMRIAKFVDCHPAYLMFGPTIAPGPDSAPPPPLRADSADFKSLSSRGGSAEQRIAIIAQIIASYWMNVSLDPRAASRATDNALRQIALLSQ